MADARDRKLFLGPRLRTLRRELGLNQTRMAEELGVSPSYLNHLERNQRPLTAQMLLRLADTYDLDVRGFVAGARDAAAGDLSEILADDLVRDLAVGRQEALDIAENYPGVAEAMRRLYRALADLRQLPGRIEAGLADGAAASPIAWTRDWLEASGNHFADLDAAAEALAHELDGGDLPEAAIRARLASAHGIAVRVVPQDVLAGASRHYDYHRRRLLLAEGLPATGRQFGAAVQLAQLALAEPIAAAAAASGAPDAETASLVARMLANYAAGALVMPYARFHAAAEASGYDLDLLAGRFGVSIEQAAHRACTLARPGARGVPLFLLKLDIAGNVVKRHAGFRVPFARYGGGCPRWRVHAAMRHGGETVVDLVELPDGERHLTWARTVRSYPQAEPALLILGCDVRQASRLRYAPPGGDGVATPIGPACHLCERVDCAERSLPPITRALAASPLSRPLGRYVFRPV